MEKVSSLRTIARRAGAIAVVAATTLPVLPALAQAAPAGQWQDTSAGEALAVPSPTKPTPAPFGPEVRAKLASLGLWFGNRPVGVDQTRWTMRSVCLWRELTHGRPSRATPAPSEVRALLATKRVDPRIPAPLVGTSAMVNMTCQAAYLVKGDRITGVFPVSTGANKTTLATRTGMKTVWNRVWGWDFSWEYPEPDGQPGLYRPVYFDRGIAFHGIRQPIDTIPRSHGCVRTNRADQDRIFDALPVGSRVWVYGDYWARFTSGFGL